MVHIEGNSLIAQWYRHWQKLGGHYPYQENLCHFMRVLLIYAPIRFVLFQKLLGIDVMWWYMLGFYLGGLLYMDTVQLATILLAAALVFAGGIVFIYSNIAPAADRIERELKEAASLWKQRRHAKESRICPFVSIGND